LRKQPIIFLLTPVNSSDVKNKVLLAGADEYLTKPTNFNKLVDLIAPLDGLQTEIARFVK